ncbi:choice-of-anchor A family protein, partial [Neolewinella lacunae]
MNNFTSLSDLLSGLFNSSNMLFSTSLQRQATRLLFVFVALLSLNSTLVAQQGADAAANGAAENAPLAQRLQLLEYTIYPESRVGAQDDRIRFETNGTAGQSLDFSAELNGKTIKKRLPIDAAGYAELLTPSNGTYLNVKVMGEGVTLYTERELGVYTRSIPYSLDNLPTVLGEQDASYTGKPLEDAVQEKLTGCVNNKLTDRSFESGGSAWAKNSGAYVVNTSQSGEYIYDGSKSLKMDLAGAYAGQSFNLGGHREYCFSVYAKNHSSAGSFYVGVKFYNSANQYISEVTLTVARNTGYNLYQFDGFSPANTAKAEVFFYRDNSTNSDGWVDLVCFQDKGTVINGGTPPSGFLADCGDGKMVDLYASDVNCGANPQASITIPSSGNVYQVVVEVVYKGANPGNDTYVTASNGNNYLVSKANVPNQGNTGFHVYRGLIPVGVGGVWHSAAGGLCTNNSTGNSGLQSLTAYAFRNITTDRAGSGVFTSLTGYNSLASFDIPIPTAALTRDVVLKIPFSEITLDGRYVRLNAKVDGILLGSQTWTFGPAGGPCCIDILELTVPNVPGGASVITVEVDTRNGQGPGGVNGQSYTIAGLAYIDLVCPKNDGDCILSFRAKGDCGHEQVQLKLDGVAVATYVLSTSFQTFTFNNFTTGKDVELHFINDATNGCDLNVELDYVKIGDDTYQTETAATRTGCGTADRLHCNGFFDFGKLYCCALTSPGQISTDHVNVCVNAGATYDPPVFDATAATCSGGSTPQYQWQIKPEQGGNWTNIPGATGEDYNPPAYGVGSRWFRRQAKCSCESAFTEATNVRDVHIRENPAVSVSVTPAPCVGGNTGSATLTPTGGNTPYTYVWSSGGTGNSRTNLAPGNYTVTVTSAAGGCTLVVPITIVQTVGPLANITCAADPLKTRTSTNSQATCNSDNYGFYIANLPGSYNANGLYSIQNGTFVENSNGTALYTATMVNNANANAKFEVSVIFRGRTFTAPAGSPKENTQCVGDLNNTDWYYYTELDGTATGQNALSGAVLQFARMGEAFQVGVGANLNNASAFGASGWFTLSVKKQPTNGPGFGTGTINGDFNFNLSGTKLNNEPADCLDICVGESTTISANGSQGQAPYTYLWSNGATTQSITISPTATTTYTVTVTDANGCTDTDEATVTVNQAAWDHVNLGSNATNCGAPCNGSIVIDPNLNTTGAFYVEYTYNGSVVRFPATGTINDPGDTVIPGLCGGTYSNITIVGLATGCRAVWPDDVVITEPQSFTVMVPNVTECEYEQARLTATVTPAGNYAYLWSNGATTPSITFNRVRLADAKTYRVTVTNPTTGCTSVASATLTVIQNFTNGGQIAANQENCGPFDAALLTSVSLPSGGTGSGTPQYIWLKTTGDCTPPTIDNMGSWVEIPGANQASFDPGIITETTCFIRCARYPGCELYLGESNVVTITIEPPVTANAGVDQTICECIQSTPSNGSLNALTFGYNAFVEGQSTVVSGESEGPLATGGNFRIEGDYGVSGFTAGNLTASGEGNPIALLIGGRIFFTSGNGVNVLNNGFIKLGNATGSNIITQLNGSPQNTRITPGGFDSNPRVLLATMQSEASVTGAAPVNFSTSFAAIRAYSTSLSQEAGNVTVGSGVVTLNLTAGQTNYLNLTGAQLSSINQVMFGSVFPSVNTPLVINVNAGGTYVWSLPTWAGAGNELGQYIIWNFTNTTTLTLNGGQTILGTVLAPNAYLNKVGSGNIEGQVIAASYRHGAGELHVRNFIGDIHGQADCADIARSVTLTATGGSNYLWSTGATTASITVSPLATTTYSVTVTNPATGCNDSDEVTVFVTDIPTISIDPVSTLCEDDAPVNLSATPVGGTFSGPGVSGNSFNPAAVGPGTYTILYSLNQNGCESEASIIVMVAPTPDVLVAPLSVCVGDAAVQLSASPSGGTFSGPGVSGNMFNPSGLTAGSYTITYTYTSPEGCTASGTATATVRPEPVAQINVNANDLCSGEQVTYTAANAGAGATYTWNFGSFAVPSTATGIGPHVVTYTLPSGQLGNGSATASLTVELAGCFNEDTEIINIKDLPEVTNVVSTNPTCGEDNGTITITYSDNPNRSIIKFSIDGGLTYPYSVADDNGSFTITGLDAGSYNLFAVWGQNDCPVDVQDATLTAEDGPSVTASDDVTICTGGSVTITANANGGTGMITYNWMPGNRGGSSITVNPTTTTTYTVTATDANGCTSTEQVVITVVPDPEVSINADGSDVCVGGSIAFTSTVSGGLNCQAVQWQIRTGTSGSFTNVSTGPTYTTATNLAPGTYQVRASYVCNGTGCDADDSNIVTINVIADPEVSISINDGVICLDETATLTATPTGGLNCQAVIWQRRTGTMGAFTNLPTTGNTLVTDANLAAGTYQYRARLVCGGEECTDDNSNVITLVIKPDPAGTVSNPTICAGENGTLTVTMTAGDAPFTYVWQSNASTTNSATYGPLSTTTSYNVTVTDANGCDVVLNGTINVTPLPVAEISPLAGNECEGTQYTFTATNAGANATYQWNFGAMATPATATGAGPHLVTYTTANASTDNNTTVTLTVTKDNCIATDTESVRVRPLPDVTITAENDPSTCSGSNGSITVSVIKPAGSTVEISLDGGQTFEDCDQTQFTGLSAGTYNLVARYCNDDCPVPVGTVILEDPLSPVAEINGPAEICEVRSTTGFQATFTATNAGLLTTYNWNFGPGASPQTATGRTPGPVTFSTPGIKNITLTVTRLGCTASDGFTLTVNEAPTVSIDPVTVCAEENATLVANVSGGEAPYTYLWSNGGGTNQSATYRSNYTTVATSETYSVTVTDANGCATVQTGTINVNPLPVPDLSNDVLLCEGESTTLLVENVFFSTATPFTYQWTKEGSSTVLSTTTSLEVTPAMLSLGANNFFARVTDANGCFERDVVMVTVRPEPTVTVQDQTICEGEMATLTAVPGAGNGTFTYEWFAAGSNTLLGTAATLTVSPSATMSYTVIVTSTYNESIGSVPTVARCTAQATATVTVNENPEVVITTSDADEVTCANQEVILTANVSGGEAPYSIEWTVGNNPAVVSTEATLTVSPAVTTTYLVKVTDTNGCMDTDQITITVNPAVCASLGDYVWEDTNGNGINDEPASAGVGGVTVNLKDANGNVIDNTSTGPNGFYAFTGLVPGTYSVQFVLPNGYNFTTLGAVGSNETNDSDADPAMNGMTDPVTLVNGQNYPDLDAGIQRVPSMEVEKTFISAVVQPDGSYNVTYTISVINTGGIGTYSLSDTPDFDDDITINSGSYTGADAGALNVVGATVLTTNNQIAADATETFTLTYNVTLDLTAGSTDGGDNVYTACGSNGPNGNGTPGAGLYNLAELDTNGDGQPDSSDDACGDLPNVELAKTFVSATVQPDGSYNVVYTIAVTNNGGATGTYGLTDTPSFDDDVTINGGTFSGEASGTLTAGTTTLTTNNSIAAGATETFTLTYNVTLDLTPGSNDGGDNVYTACGNGGPNGEGTPGQGLYNTAYLDTNGDGQPDASDDACGDLPNVELEKTFVSATVQPNGSYNVVYTIAVTNNGGATGTYGLTDTPAFDNDVTINGGTFSGEASGTLTAGTTTLTTNNSIAAGATET